MFVKIGDEKMISTKENAIVTFKNNTQNIVIGNQTKFLYVNPDEVKMVCIGEKIDAFKE